MIWIPHPRHKAWDFLAYPAHDYHRQMKLNADIKVTMINNRKLHKQESVREERVNI